MFASVLIGQWTDEQLPCRQAYHAGRQAGCDVCRRCGKPFHHFGHGCQIKVGNERPECSQHSERDRNKQSCLLFCFRHKCNHKSGSSQCSSLFASAKVQINLKSSSDTFVIPVQWSSTHYSLEQK